MSLEGGRKGRGGEGRGGTPREGGRGWGGRGGMTVIHIILMPGTIYTDQQ